MEKKHTNIDDKSLILLAQGKGIALEVPEQEKKNIQKNAKEKLCIKYKPLILHYGNKAHVKTIRDDVIAYLWLVLLQAIEKYEVEGTVPVEGYFKSCIYYAVWNYFKREKHKWNFEFLPASEELDTVIESLGAENQTPEKMYIEDEEILYLREAISTLSEEEQELLNEFYKKERPLNIIAKVEGVTKQALSYRHRRILDKLKVRLEASIRF